MLHTRLRATAAILAFGFSLSAASAQMVYNRGNPGDPETLDPQKTSTVVESDVLLDLYEGLVTYDAKAQIVPGVAESWAVNDDGTVYTFKLRPNAKWSNGDPVKAQDFVFSFRRLMNPETGAKYANILYTLKNGEKVNKGQAKVEELGVKAIDDRTLEITLEAPAPYFVAQLAHQTGLPVHPGSVEKFGKDFVKPENMVSNGAFMLKSFTPNDKIVMVKNPNYRDAASVKIDQVNVISAEDRSAALRRFQAGELHTYNDVPTDQIKFIRETLKGQFRVAPYLGTYYFAVNTQKAPFNDARVRQALSMVIDRDFLAEDIWGGTMIPAYSFVPPGIGNYGEPATVDWKDMSPIEREDKAKALLKEAGYGPGGKKLTVEIRYNTSENHKNTSVALANMWKPFNIEVKLVNTDLKTHYALLRDKGDYDIARAGWIADYSDPQNFLFLAESDNKGLNYASYANPEYDALMKKAAGTKDLQARAKILQQAEAVFLRDQPYLPLLFYGSKNLVSDKVSGWESNTLDRHLSRFLTIKQ
ncbi:peptide ABC transporter substrate-binding protein [Alsobacter sp. SYSU M60028]|uniref:Peptide ABC transporter substrate-binding protein n=1 Tax=Alsobacter ponti TaxID=2962936 RepID=A0ABT1LAS3_9HYPH|nr:peptide ABC transporter substrate-binding protein [Alsobacter ponti]MCP8938581.1 peptide ABC transporter substrate-binding protein [Alsobacter ponti]